MMRKFFIFILALLTMNALILAQDYSAQDKTYSIPKANGQIKVDGNLDEKSWSQALKINLDVEVMPAENVEAPVKTECFLIFDENHIYVGFKAYDPNPQKIRAYLSDRDEMYNHDNVGVFLDTFNDNNRGFAFFSNPLGIQGDEIMSRGGSQEDQSWDAIWNSAGNITDFGYVVEMAIPFRSLQFQPSEEKQVWGFTPVRNYPRSRRHQTAPFPLDRNNMQCILCQLPDLKGFQNATPGRNIELDPTITGMRTDQREDFPEGKMKKESSRVDLGVTGQWGLTNNLTL
ncbi:carbohydrate binding family 9 domain-containing protein, partial [bacterium]|nr:carbohydrate binding family 9 domain-containing protein [bacterium]